MSVCVCSVFVLACVQVAGCDGLIPRPRIPTDCVKHKENEKVAKFQQKAVEP
jgi:hypothetical protein